jgi:hypothetical protein
MSSNGEILCGCGKPAVCAHVKSDDDWAILSCEEHEYELSHNGWRKIPIDEYEIFTVMNS